MSRSTALWPFKKKWEVRANPGAATSSGELVEYDNGMMTESMITLAELNRLLIPRELLKGLLGLPGLKEKLPGFFVRYKTTANNYKVCQISVEKRIRKDGPNKETVRTRIILRRPLHACSALSLGSVSMSRFTRRELHAWLDSVLQDNAHKEIFDFIRDKYQIQTMIQEAVQFFCRWKSREVIMEREEKVSLAFWGQLNCDARPGLGPIITSYPALGGIKLERVTEDEARRGSSIATMAGGFVSSSSWNSLAIMAPSKSGDSAAGTTPRNMDAAALGPSPTVHLQDLKPFRKDSSTMTDRIAEKVGKDAWTEVDLVLLEPTEESGSVTHSGTQTEPVQEMDNPFPLDLVPIQTESSHLASAMILDVKTAVMIKERPSSSSSGYVEEDSASEDSVDGRSAAEKTQLLTVVVDSDAMDTSSCTGGSNDLLAPGTSADPPKKLTVPQLSRPTMKTLWENPAEASFDSSLAMRSKNQMEHCRQGRITKPEPPSRLRVQYMERLKRDWPQTYCSRTAKDLASRKLSLKRQVKRF